MGRNLTAQEIGELMGGLAIEREPVDGLCEYEGNAKKHTAEQVGQIKASIREFGMIDPIGVWTNAEGKSEVVEGHGRLMAARELGLAEVPVIHLDALTDEQRRAYALVHNQLTMNTGWDFGKLDAELDELSMDFDMEGFGFDEAAQETGKETDCQYSDSVGKVDYEPKDMAWRTASLFDLRGKYEELGEVIAKVSDPEVRRLCELRRSVFADIKFARVADYYAYQASSEEQRAFEALGLVLLDRDQMIQNGFADIVGEV